MAACCSMSRRWVRNSAITPPVLTAFNELLDRLRSLPGVVAAGSTFNFPLRAGPENALLVHLEGDPDPARNLNSRQRIVSPGSSPSMGVKLIAGRDFSVDDRPGSPRVAIVNRSFARQLSVGQRSSDGAIHRRLSKHRSENVWTIVGVVDDIRQRSLSVPPEPAYYTSSGQGTPRRQAFVVHASGGDSASLRSAIRDETRKLDPQMAIDIERASDIVDCRRLSRQRLGMTLMLGFGIAAVALAAVGIYGVIAYGVAQRRNEVAIRLALGRDAEKRVLAHAQARTHAGGRWRDHRRRRGVCIWSPCLELAVRGPGIRPQ